MTEFDLLRAERAALIKEVADDDRIIHSLVELVEALTAVARHAVSAAADADPLFCKQATEVLERGQQMMAVVAAGRAEAALQSAPTSKSVN